MIKAEIKLPQHNLTAAIKTGVTQIAATVGVPVLTVEKNPELAAFASEVAGGKEAISQALRNQGIDSSPADSFASMAAGVDSISPTVIGDDRAIWNYEAGDWNILHELYRDEHQFGNYHTCYIVRFSPIFESILLSGADAYMTSDGRFYNIGTNHVWEDKDSIRMGRTRWVIYYYLRMDGVFQPLIDINFAGGTSELEMIIHDCEINRLVLTNSLITKLDFTDRCKWNEARSDNASALSGSKIAYLKVGLKEISCASFSSGCANLQTIVLPELTKVSGGTIFTGCSSIRIVNLPKVTTLSTYTFQSCAQLKEIYIPMVHTFLGAAPFNASNSVETILLKSYPIGFPVGNIGTFDVFTGVSAANGRVCNLILEPDIDGNKWHWDIPIASMPQGIPDAAVFNAEMIKFMEQLANLNEPQFVDAGITSRNIKVGATKFAALTQATKNYAVSKKYNIIV